MLGLYIQRRNRVLMPRKHAREDSSEWLPKPAEHSVASKALSHGVSLSLRWSQLTGLCVKLAEAEGRT